MDKGDRLRRLSAEYAGNITICENEPMAKHTSFGAGGTADYYCGVRNADALRALVRVLREADIPYFILGNGTNVLVSDRGYRGAVIPFKNGDFGTLRVTDDCMITAGSACPLEKCARFAMEQGFSGMEGLSGIPGLTGGALTMNAGAYGTEMKDVVSAVRAIDLDAEELPEVTFTKEEMRFGYRTGIAKTRRLFFTECVFALQKGDAEAIRETMRRLDETRRAKQPLEYRSAGSAFKRPAGSFAGKLIEEAGLKGASEGGAQVSEKHCGFIVNKGGASASDILALMRRVRDTVQKNSGVVLEPEVIILGETL